MTTYLQSPVPMTHRFDISRWLWDLWELPAVKAWLKTSGYRELCLKRLEMGIRLYKSALWWSLNRSMVPDHPVDQISLNANSGSFGDFAPQAVMPTAAAERQIIEQAATDGHSWIEHIEAEQCREILLEAPWRVARPIHELNRYLIDIVGEDGPSLRLH